MSNFWISDDTYVKKINGKVHLVRIRKHSPSKGDAAEKSSRSASRSRNVSTQRSSTDDNGDDASESRASSISAKLDKLADLFTGTSSLRTEQQEKQAMADKEGASDDASNKSSQAPSSATTENVVNPNFPGPGLPIGFQAQPGIYQFGGRTLALMPTAAAKSNTGYIGGGYPPGAYGPYMYGGGPGPMGGMMMQPQMGMGMGNAGFGGFNSQYDRMQPVEVTTVTPATSITVTRHVCANCGTLRSRKFQAENPLEPGEQPPISYCRKCEKEIRSTDEESDGDIQLSKGKKLRRASYMQMPEPQVVVQPVIIKEKYKKHKKEKQAEKQESKPVVAKGDTALLHTCAQCGRARSRKYQARHPIRKGETPPPAFCGKCQKEETSSEDSDKSDDEKSNASHSQRSRDGRHFVTVPMVDERVVTRRHKQVRLPPPVKVVEEYSSSSESEVEMPPPRRRSPHKKTNSSNNKKKYESIGEDLMIEHRQRDHRDDTEHRGRARGRAESQSHHHRHERRSIYEVPSPLVQETIITERVPVRRARSLDRGDRPVISNRARSASRHASKQMPPREHRYDDRGDYESYDSDGGTEEAARALYKAYLSDGAPMHEEHRHYRHEEKVKHRGGDTMTHSESFDSNKFSEASKNRRRERSASGHAPAAYYPSVQQEVQPPDPVLQRPPDEVIVTTERFVFKKPSLPASATNSHFESVKSERHERDSNASSRHSQKYLTHQDKAQYYPAEWSGRYGRRESVSRPPMIVRETVRHEGKEYDDNDTYSIDPVPGSFIDADESARSIDSYYEERVSNPSHMLRHKENTESISTDRTSETWTSSGSRSSKDTSTSQRERYASNRGGATPRPYHTGQLPGGYPADSEMSASSGRGRRDSNFDRGRRRSPDRRADPSRRDRSRSNYHQPSVSDASEDSLDSDHATAGVSRSRSNSRDRGRSYKSREGSDPSELTANDRIRTQSRKRRVSFGGKDEYHTYSQVSLGSTGVGTTTDEVLHDIQQAREVERRREDERRERRRRERSGERDEMKRRGEKERQRQKDLDYGYASGRG